MHSLTKFMSQCFEDSLFNLHRTSERPTLHFRVSRINFLNDLLDEPEDFEQWKAAVDSRERYGGFRDVGANGVGVVRRVRSVFKGERECQRS